MCLPDNILGIETTLACFAASKKILITCSEAAFTRKSLLLSAPAVSTTQHKVFKIEDLSCSIWQISRLRSIVREINSDIFISVLCFNMQNCPE